jgi:hypothetical protein
MLYDEASWIRDGVDGVAALDTGAGAAKLCTSKLCTRVPPVANGPKL